jgi:LysM repeat protein
VRAYTWDGSNAVSIAGGNTDFMMLNGVPEKDVLRLMKETAEFGNAGKTERKKGTETKKPEKVEQRPLSPTVIEQVQPAPEQVRNKYFQFELTRKMYSKNGVPFIYISEGETYQSIAKSYGLFLKELLRFNDLEEPKPLLPGTVVYIQPKKNGAAKGLDMHVLESGETLWDIAQRYGVKLDRIYKLNGWNKAFVPREGTCIKLRK